MYKLEPFYNVQAGRQAIINLPPGSDPDNAPLNVTIKGANKIATFKSQSSASIQAFLDASALDISKNHTYQVNISDFYSFVTYNFTVQVVNKAPVASSNPMEVANPVAVGTTENINVLQYVVDPEGNPMKATMITKLPAYMKFNNNILTVAPTAKTIASTVSL